MLSSIHPLGERARNNRWGVTAGAFIFGAVAGGVTLGSLAGATGWLVHQATGWAPSSALVAAIVVVAVVVVGDLAGWPQALPWPNRQVNEDWLATYRGWVYGSGFGFQLGAGLFTYVATLGVFAVIAISFLSASVAGGALIGAAFGLFRGIPVLTTSRIHNVQALREYHLSMARKAGVARSAALVAQVGVLAGVFAWVVAS